MKNSLITSLKKLKLLEVNILLGHVRLGEAHLKKYLDQKQFNELLLLGSLKNEQKQNIKSNKAEKSGTVALVLNTIITSVFGAWMGFSGFMGLSLGSFAVLAGMSALAIIISGFVGYYSFKLTHNTAKNAIAIQKIHNLQVKLVEICIEKRQDHIVKLTEYLIKTLRELDEAKILVNKPKQITYTFDTSEEVSHWIDDLNQVIKYKINLLESEKIYSYYGESLSKIIIKLEKALANNKIIRENAFSKTQSSLLVKDKNNNKSVSTHSFTQHNSFIEILTDPNIVAPKAKLKKRPWLFNNLTSIIVGLAPTILGGFASMFVFLAGGPNLAKDLGLRALELALKQPNARMIELTIAISLTLYYGFSSIYNNRKAYIRDRELATTRTRLANEEANLIELNAKFNMLEKAKMQLHHINNIYTALTKISPFWEENKQKINDYIKQLESLKVTD